MNEILTGILAWSAGAGLGMIFFGGLWWTVRKGVSSGQPALWFLGSLLLRMGVVLIGFYLVAGHQLLQLLLCLFGFVMARMVVFLLTRLPGENQSRPVREINHAS